MITQVRACQQQETAWRNRARNLLIRAGYAVPRTVALREWFAAQGAELDETLQIVFTSALTMAEQAQQEGDRLRGEILRRLAGYPEMAWLWSVPGLGAWTAAVVWAWLGDPQRFRSARQVGRYAGLDPSVHQSGEADWRGHISHQGPAILRQVLVEAAWWAIRAKDTPLRTFYARVVPRLGKRRAIVAVARKLLLAAWRVWHEQRLAHEVDWRRYQKKLSAIRAILRTVPSYPLTDRWQILTGAEGSAPDRAATEARGQPVLSTIPPPKFGHLRSLSRGYALGHPISPTGWDWGTGARASLRPCPPVQKSLAFLHCDGHPGRLPSRDALSHRRRGPKFSAPMQPIWL
nr:transposase [Sulfobacillus thermosulfidooxidans]